MVGYHVRRTEFPEGAKPGKQQSGTYGRPGERKTHAEEAASRPMAERRGDILQDRIDRGKRRAGGNDQEWRGDESFRQHDARKGVCERTANQLANEAVGAKQKQQQHPAGQGRQGQGQLDHEGEPGHPMR